MCMACIQVSSAREAMGLGVRPRAAAGAAGGEGLEASALGETLRTQRDAQEARPSYPPTLILVS